jgi:hypothetical protein
MESFSVSKLAEHTVITDLQRVKKIREKEVVAYFKVSELCLHF